MSVDGYPKMRPLSYRQRSLDDARWSSTWPVRVFLPDCRLSLRQPPEPKDDPPECVTQGGHPDRRNEGYEQRKLKRLPSRCPFTSPSRLSSLTKLFLSSRCIKVAASSSQPWSTPCVCSAPLPVPITLV